MEQNRNFDFTYSAAQQQEIENIRSKYLPKEEQEEDKMQTLRRLHNSAGQKALRWAVIWGTIGTLIMGTGMSLVMTELGALLGKFGLVIGIAIGLVGIVLVALAYPLYNRILKKERARIAPQILRLSEELLK
jgi:hypothetical protein